MKTLLVLLSIFFVSCSNKQEYKKPASTKYAIIPAEAFYVKGKTGGYWCTADVHPHRNNAIIKLYDQQTRKVILTKRFGVICILQGNPLWIDDLENQIDYFDGEKFHLKRLAGQDSCWLQ